MLKELKLSIIKEIKLAKPSIAHVDDATLYHETFSYPSTVRLTYSGYLHIRHAFKEYSFDFNGLFPTPRQLMTLAKVMKFPYYITYTKLVVFSETDAIMITLYGSVHQFLESSELII